MGANLRRVGDDPSDSLSLSCRHAHSLVEQTSCIRLHKFTFAKRLRPVLLTSRNNLLGLIAQKIRSLSKDKMTTADSETRISTVNYARLLSQLAGGMLDGLQCPECDQRSVSVCFTPHHANEYRSWLICASCDFRSRTHNRTRSSRSTVDPAVLAPRKDARPRNSPIFKHQA